MFYGIRPDESAGLDLVCRLGTNFIGVAGAGNLRN